MGFLRTMCELYGKCSLLQINSTVWNAVHFAYDFAASSEEKNNNIRHTFVKAYMHSLIYICSGIAKTIIGFFICVSGPAHANRVFDHNEQVMNMQLENRLT